MSTQPKVSKNERPEFVSFVSGGQDYCVEVTKVREIRRWSAVTILPHTPRCFLGVMNLRGEVIPIIDLALRLGFERTMVSARHVVLILVAGDRTVGLLVDSVAEILKVSEGALRGVPEFQASGSRLVKGVIALDGATLRILDIDAIAPALTESPT